MTGERDTGRRTPYELVFGDERFAEFEFPAIAEEAERRGASVWRYDRFTLLERVAALLAQVLPEDAEPAAVDQHLQILYHGYHFWGAGRPLYAFDAGAVRSLIESAPALSGWSLQTPRPALYIELPKNLFWAQVTGSGPPEPVEGMFAAREPDAPAAELDLLIVLGLRQDRPGFTVAGLHVDPGRLSALDQPATFRSDIPGADLAGLYSLGRHAEAALLALRALWYLDSYPRACRPSRHEGAPEELARDGLTTLEHFKVTLIERSDG